MVNNTFLRCLSKQYVRLTEREQDEILKALDASNQGSVNYMDFLKYSYLCHLYINHYKLEMLLQKVDKEGRGMITVGQLDDILQSDHFFFPKSALDMVFQEMLESGGQQVDRNCIIKIDAFLQSLKSQFEK